MERNQTKATNKKSHGGVAERVGLERCYERTLEGSSKAIEANSSMAQMGNSFIHFGTKFMYLPALDAMLGLQGFSCDQGSPHP